MLRYRMRLIALAVLTLAFGQLALQAQEGAPAAEGDKQALLALIDRFLKQPLNEQLRVALLDSAEARPDVTLTLSASVTPSLCYEEPAAVIRALDALLLTAFVAGNMQEQLLTGRKGDQPFAGVMATLSVYDILRDKVRNYSVPEIDQWRELQTSGTLRAHVDSLAQNPAPDCSKKKPRYPANARLAPQE